MKRTHYCGTVTQSLLGQTVTICGWVHRRRDHGGVIFLDIRDRTGLVQLVFEPENKAVFHHAETLRNEYVIQATALVKARPQGQENSHMATGQIELIGQELEILAESEPPPFPLDDEHYQVGETVRLKHRMLDLRRPQMQGRLLRRSHIVRVMRRYLDDMGFLDMETPMLTRATPEGARDYLVPSRTQHGHVYALPQSPQLFKQLYMMAGFDRYYQVVRCFRDEDLRADRQPEFTQLDIECSFVDEKDIQDLIEGLLKAIFKEVMNVEIKTPFLRLSYDEVIRDYASDKPDLRIPLKLVDINDCVQDVEFKVFADAAKSKDCRVVAMNCPRGCETLSRKMLDDYATFVGLHGAKGLAYIKVNDRKQGLAGCQSPILKFLNETVVNQILDRVGANTGDVVFFGADKTKVVNESMGALRIKLGRDLNLYTQEWALLWVERFPMFEAGDDGSVQAMHHPFTQPMFEHMDEITQKPLSLYARAYDVVLNGYELGGGSIRNHTQELQYRVLEAIGFTREQAMEKFGFLMTALQYGAPPHGGIALGVDRVAMILSGAESLRDVLAFPKTQQGTCLFTGAPSIAEPDQLTNLGLRMKASETKL